MKKKLSITLLLGILATGSANAVPLTVCNFEDYEIGTVWPMWHLYGGDISSVATVEQDPCNPNNKVLHIQLKDWCCHPEFTLPTELRGSAITNRYPTLRYKLYRSLTDADNWKQFAAFIGSQELYRDEGYPDQGSIGVWQTRNYALKAVEDDNSSGQLRLGIHHNNSDYYIDDIQLVGPYDDCISTEDGGTIDYCENNTSSSYKTIDSDIYIPAGQSLNVRTSRYTEWTGQVMGEGTLNIHSGGERSYLGTASSKGATYPDWALMKGDVNLYPYKEMVGTCGFYGLILSSGTFQPENINGSNYNRIFADKKLTLHPGATLAVESGTRGIRIGELQTLEGSMLSGYYKKSTATSYYILGARNTDATLAGEIASTTQGNKVGLIKEGKGCYRITGNNNSIDAGIRILEGSLMANNDAEATISGKLTGATGTAGTLTVFKGATLGGWGTIGCTTEVYGQVKAGDGKPGTLRLMNTSAPGTAVSVTLHPEAQLVCPILDASTYSQILIEGTLLLNTKTQDFEESERQPRLIITTHADSHLQVGDEFTLLRATSKPSSDWSLTIRYPKAYTWQVDQLTDADGSFRVVARITSLDYSGQGDTTDDEEEEAIDNGYPDEDVSEDLNDPTPLRSYAQKLGKWIGVAAASYRYDCSSTEGPAAIVGAEFNLVVGENEMKFDATEPNRSEFNYGGADAVMALADRCDQEVRGHTLAWHSQVPGWVSEDGKKNNHNYSREELLDILKNHIQNVAGNYKGRIREWDVVNEVLDDDQSIVRTQPDAYKLRPSIWNTYIGEDFIDSAFVWAHQVDPTAKLYINEYGAEMMGGAKSEAYFNLVKRLQKSGIPIDGCGLQCHFTTGEVDTLKLEKNIRRYAELGLNCIITELDIALANPYAAEALETQAKEYAAITRVFLRNANCPSMLIWGLADHYSWRQNQPLLWDSQLQAKPAYYYVHAQLRKAASDATAISSVPPSDSETIRIVCRNLAGQTVSPNSRGILIEQGLKRDGSLITVKRINR